ncbi:MAG: type 1 periplasmic binding fold superfamily protein [Bacteroidota bacterium]
MKISNLSNLNKFFVLLFAAVVLLPACTPDEPIDGEEEIDTVRVLIDGQTIEWKVDDTTNPTITLEAGKSYTVEVQFWNLEENENVTLEVQEEDDEHLVCYEVTGAAMTVTATDSDGSLPIGLATTWEAATASTGTLQLELRHQPGEKDGTCTPGDTDILADFEIVIQ